MKETDDKDEQFMRKALYEAEKAAEEGEIPIGAVIVCNDRIISRAHNLTEKLHDVTAHALRNNRTLCHVCWCHWMGTNRTHCLWSKR